MKDIILICGPNGAGKTTAAQKLLPKFPGVLDFLNADEFARMISPENVESAAFSAGRKMLQQMRKLIALDRSFAIESTLSGRSYLSLLKRCKQNGWRITLLFLWLPSPEVAVRRVAHRVQEGGHGIPAEAVRRRYFSGLRNLLNLYLPLADEAEIYDNSSRRVRIATRTEGGVLLVLDSDRWKKLKRVCNASNDIPADS